MIKFRVALWFKNHGKGSEVDLSLLILDLSERCVDLCSVKPNRVSAWIPPYVSDLSFNVDGSSRGNRGDAGIGGILWDFSSKIICLFFSFVGVMDAITAEILAIHRACQLIVGKQPLQGCLITIFSDLKTAVSWCNGEDFGSLNVVNLVYDIRQYLLSCVGFQIKFMPRESNSFADCLAKNGSSRSGDRLEWGDLS
ncbi:hypothetical protein Dsin_025787 [Dipteronia sinensis]|uniref:RNase H type-1 domain-containing protein n=1 Tax=Dipteronia sinensis TaxID=43782 RepID=A0AAE0DXA5_9ROSI|nr:hypothetical protein Dsin_025787 [Dipteronia sinensis]